MLPASLDTGVNRGPSDQPPRTWDLISGRKNNDKRGVECVAGSPYNCPGNFVPASVFKWVRLYRCFDAVLMASSDLPITYDSSTSGDSSDGTEDSNGSQDDEDSNGSEDSKDDCGGCMLSEDDRETNVEATGNLQGKDVDEEEDLMTFLKENEDDELEEEDLISHLRE